MEARLQGISLPCKHRAFSVTLLLHQCILTVLSTQYVSVDSGLSFCDPSSPINKLVYEICPLAACSRNLDNSCCYHQATQGCVCPHYLMCGRNIGLQYGGDRQYDLYSVDAPQQQVKPTTENKCLALDPMGRVQMCHNRPSNGFDQECASDMCRENLNGVVCCVTLDESSNTFTCLCHSTVRCAPPTEDSKVDKPDSSKQKPDSSKQKPDSSKEKTDKSLKDPEQPTKPTKSLCGSQNRILNGNAVDDDCEYKGIAKVTTKLKGKDVISCNAVFAIATVGGNTKQTFLTADICKKLIETANKDKNNFETNIEIGSKKYPLQPPIFYLKNGEDGNAFIDINSRYVNLFRKLGDCQSKACPFNFDKMNKYVDTSDCQVVSWGSSDAATLRSDGLYEMAVEITPAGCAHIEKEYGGKNRMCVRTKSGDNMYCVGDAGAPTYCRSPSTQEWILMGVLAFQANCDTSAEAQVIRFPL